MLLPDSLFLPLIALPALLSHLPKTPTCRGLARIDQKEWPAPPGNKIYNYPDPSGTGVTVYVTDTGVTIDHPEFEGRAVNGYDATGEGPEDLYGHGTHVSGTIAGVTVGVAKKANIVSVKVMGKHGSGKNSWVVDGIAWAVSDCLARQGGKMCVISMSLLSKFSQAMNDAVNAAFDSGVVVAVAAGNSNSNACKYSPSSAAKALTVGATSMGDARAAFSNFGACVSLFAPGVGITSAFCKSKCGRRDPYCYKAWSGTSMATPHVAGVAALAWSVMGSNATAGEVVAKVKGIATAGVVRGAKADASALMVYNQVTA